MEIVDVLHPVVMIQILPIVRSVQKSYVVSTRIPFGAHLWSDEGRAASQKTTAKIYQVRVPHIEEEITFPLKLWNDQLYGHLLKNVLVHSMYHIGL